MNLFWVSWTAEPRGEFENWLLDESAGGNRLNYSTVASGLTRWIFARMSAFSDSVCAAAYCARSFCNLARRVRRRAISRCRSILPMVTHIPELLIYGKRTANPAANACSQPVNESSLSSGGQPVNRRPHGPEPVAVFVSGGSGVGCGEADFGFPAQGCDLRRRMGLILGFLRFFDQRCA